jgi:hypothetical protein
MRRRLIAEHAAMKPALQPARRFIHSRIVSPRRPIVAIGTKTTGHQPVEAKAQAAGIAGGAAGVVLWVLQTWVFKGTAVPAGLVSLVDVAVPGVLALAGAYLAPHTGRPGDRPVITLAMPPEGAAPPVQPPAGPVA